MSFRLRTPLYHPPMKSILVFVSIAMLVGCAPKPTPPSDNPISTPAVPESPEINRSSIKVGNFTISTTLDVPMSNSIQDSQAILTFASHKVVADFDKHQLTIDNHEALSLQPDVNEIKIKFVRGTLLINVDEVLVFPPGK
jgi:hypothetical protein